jgi:hypothetical protein
MTPEYERDPADYHLRLMIEQMQRDDRSEDAIESAIRVASGWQPPAKMAGVHDNNPRARRRVFSR